MTDITARLAAIGAMLPEVEAYKDALHSTYVDRHAPDIGRTYDLVDEDAADAALAAVVGELEQYDAECVRLHEALEEIAEGRGQFSRDPLTHATNTIEDMKAIALRALAHHEEADA